MQIPQAAFCALESYRWAFRSVLRLHGYRFVKLLQQPVTAPATARRPRPGRAAARRRLRQRHRPVPVALLNSVRDFPHVEVPELFTGAVLLEWLKA